MSLRSGSKICHFELGIFKLKVNISYHEIFFCRNIKILSNHYNMSNFLHQEPEQIFYYYYFGNFFQHAKKITQFLRCCKYQGGKI